MLVNFLSSLILCSYVNCKSSYVGGNKIIYNAYPSELKRGISFLTSTSFYLPTC